MENYTSAGVCSYRDNAPEYNGKVRAMQFTLYRNDAIGNKFPKRIL